MLNLISDPWLATTNQREGILLLLENAKNTNLQISSIQFVAVLRLLLAACYHGHETSQSLLKRGIGSKTLKHLEANKPMFDLENGYFTCSDLEATVTTFASLMRDLPSGNSMVFYGHARDDISPKVRLVELAHLILAYHCAAPTGGNSATKHRGISPCANVVLGVAVGKNLLETLALNLVPDAAVPTASWTQPRVTQADFKNQTRQIAGSIAEQYTWLAQAVRLYENGVGTAQGFHLYNQPDPMCALDAKRQVIRPYLSDAILLAARVNGVDSSASRTLQHARTLGIPYSIRVVSQVSSSKYAVHVLETIDSTYSIEALQPSLLERILKIRGYLAKNVSEFTARIFTSTFEDRWLDAKKDFRLEEFIATSNLELTNNQRLEITKLAIA
jgi:hypothetical protein